MEPEISVFDKEPTNPSEIYRWKKICKIEVQDVTPVLVRPSICKDRSIAFKAVGYVAP
jgi:hypothetical protein